MQLQLRISPKAWRTVGSISLAYLAIAILVASCAFYAHPMGPGRHWGAGGWRAAADTLIGLGGLYIAIWIIALTTLWVRHEEHEAG